MTLEGADEHLVFVLRSRQRYRPMSILINLQDAFCQDSLCLCGINNLNRIINQDYYFQHRVRGEEGIAEAASSPPPALPVPRGPAVQRGSDSLPTVRERTKKIDYYRTFPAENI